MKITHPWLNETDTLALPVVVYGMLVKYGFRGEEDLVERAVSTRPLTHSDTKAVRRCLELLELHSFVARDGAGYVVTGDIVPVAHRELERGSTDLPSDANGVDYAGQPA